MIHWLPERFPGRLGFGPRPRHLGDLEGVDLVISVLTPDERRELALDWLESLNLNVEDRGLPPDRVPVRKLARQAAARLREGGHVFIHCRAGIGRSALFAGCVLAELGEGNLLARLSAARGLEVPDTPEQAAWLQAYVESLGRPQSLEEALRLLAES